MKFQKILAPYPVFCRGHSGGRLVCNAFIHNQINMGNVHLERKDTTFFGIDNPLIYKMVLNAYSYLQADTKQKQYYQDLMKCCVTNYWNQEIQTNGAFGWKMGISLFTMLILLDTFPESKVIHIIRDGRDVMLSRLEARFGNLHDPVNKLVVFGDAKVNQFEGQTLTTETIATYRNELEILHWRTAVEYGLRGRAYEGRYLEVKYEDICQNPIAKFTQIFDFLHLPFLETTKIWLQQTVYHSRIGKWQSLAKEKMEKPLEIAAPLLKQLGY